MHPHDTQNPSLDTTPRLGAQTPAGRSNGIDGKTFAIGVLAVTASVLLVGFLLIASTPQPAYAIGMNDRGGDFIMVTQQISNSVEAVVIIDAAAQRLNMYALDPNNKKLALLEHGMPLDRLPNPKRRP